MSTTIDPTAPAAEATTEKKKWVSKLIDYPVPEGTKISATPEDFDHTKHKPIKPGNFVDRPANLEHRADILERKAAALRKTAHEERTAGPALKAQKKFLAAQAMLAKLAEELTAQGIDVEALTATVEG